MLGIMLTGPTWNTSVALKFYDRSHEEGATSSQAPIIGADMRVANEEHLSPIRSRKKGIYSRRF